MPYLSAHTLSETTAQTKVFLYEPHLVTNLADLVRPDKEMPFVSEPFSRSLSRTKSKFRIYKHMLFVLLMASQGILASSLKY